MDGASVNSDRSGGGGRAPPSAGAPGKAFGASSGSGTVCLESAGVLNPRVHAAAPLDEEDDDRFSAVATVGGDSVIVQPLSGAAQSGLGAACAGGGPALELAIDRLTETVAVSSARLACAIKDLTAQVQRLAAAGGRNAGGSDSSCGGGAGVTPAPPPHIAAGAPPVAAGHGPPLSAAFTGAGANNFTAPANPAAGHAFAARAAPAKARLFGAPSEAGGQEPPPPPPAAAAAAAGPPPPPVPPARRLFEPQQRRPSAPGAAASAATPPATDDAGGVVAAHMAQLESAAAYSQQIEKLRQQLDIKSQNLIDKLVGGRKTGDEDSSLFDDDIVADAIGSAGGGTGVGWGGAAPPPDGAANPLFD